MSRKPLVMVVEDHDDSRAMMVAFLEIKGCDVMEAPDGQNVVTLARTALPDLILLDLDLPVVDGWQTAALLKEEHATRDIPVVAVSGNCQNLQLKQKALRAGCDGCIGKPVDFGRLSKILEGFLFPFAAS